MAVNAFGAGRAYTLASRFEEGFYLPFYRGVCEGLLEGAWPEPLPAGMLAVRRGRFTFLQNAADVPNRAGDVELPAYGTAVFEDGKRIL